MIWDATLCIWTLTHPTSAGVGISNHKKVQILWHQYQRCGTGTMSQLHHPCHKATTFGTCATTLLRLLIVSKLNNLINLWSQGNSPHYWSQVLGCIPHKLKIDWLLCLPVHSHNTSDMKMAHANKAMAKKNLFIPNQVIFEVNKMKGLSGRLIDDRHGIFLD